MPLRSDIEDRLNAAVFGTAVAGSRLTDAATITNVNADVFTLDNVQLHAISRLDDLGDDAQLVAAKNWATVPRTALDLDDLPKQAYTHGTLTSGQNTYQILSVATDGSLLRLFLSSELR